MIYVLKENYGQVMGQETTYTVQCKIFLTQQYRLFSNYSASLQIDMCYSDHTRIVSTII